MLAAQHTSSCISIRTNRLLLRLLLRGHAAAAALLRLQLVLLVSMCVLLLHVDLRAMMAAAASSMHMPLCMPLVLVQLVQVRWWRQHLPRSRLRKPSSSTWG